MPHVEIERKRIDTSIPGEVRVIVARAGMRAARVRGPVTPFARFERAVYAKDSGGRVVCLVPESGEDGPIHARVTGGFTPPDAPFVLAPAPVWTPPAMPAWSRVALHAGLARARAARPAPAPNPARAAYEAGLEALARWRAGAAPVEACGALIGLGTGLTPSGDDALGGAAIALHAFGEIDAARTLAAFLRAAMPGRTGDISAAFLDAACDGEGTSGFHGALAALIDGGGSFAALAAMGHSSGWDAMDGACAVLDIIARR